MEDNMEDEPSPRVTVESAKQLRGVDELQMIGTVAKLGVVMACMLGAMKLIVEGGKQNGR